MKGLDLRGQTFGRLTLKRPLEQRNGQGKILWEAVCSCGQASIVVGYKARSGEIQSCGCLMSDNRRAACTKHDHSNSPTYNSYRRMIARCYDVNNDGFHNYGGRGIAVCEQWLGDGGFALFLKFMGPRPSRAYSVDRIEVNGNYEPGNVRWATPVEQARNKRTNRMLTVGGRTLCVFDWAVRVKMNPRTILSRLRRGWDVASALSTPLTRVGQ